MLQASYKHPNSEEKQSPIPYRSLPVPDPNQGKNRVKGKERVGTRVRAQPPPRKTPLPPDLAISPPLQAWADEHGYGDLERHLEAFKDKATARGYQYADWEAALRNAIRDDWAKLREVRPNPPPPPRNRKPSRSRTFSKGKRRS